jgi:hypothetical protein
MRVRYNHLALNRMNRLLALVWFGLCGLLAYYSLVEPNHFFIRSLIGAVMFVIWRAYLIRKKRKSFSRVYVIWGLITNKLGSWP